MNHKKKLQVFVSSTYNDLRAERQAAVEAILTAGHIPAGMELFSAGDQTQMNVIKRWIDESDVFLLILGGRYGSLEPTSGKSYIQLEYEYAIEREKPLFAVVIDEDHRKDRIKSLGELAVETENAPKLTMFRELVLSKLVRFWSDPKDIKLAIHETMAEFARRDELKGWLPGTEIIDTGSLAEELARLAKENSRLRQIVEAHAPVQLYNGLQYDELINLLGREYFEPVSTQDKLDDTFVVALRNLAETLEQPHATLRDALWLLRERIIPSTYIRRQQRNLLAVMIRLTYYGIVSETPETDFLNEVVEYKVTADGQRFVLRVLVESVKRNINETTSV